VSFGRNHSDISLHVQTDGLTDDLTASHIHEAPIGMAGSVIVDLTAFYSNGAMSLDGAQTDTSLINRIRAGNTYINVHTNMHPSGELRGQIVKDFLCTLETGVEPLDDIISEVMLSPVPVFEQLNVNMTSEQSATLKFSISDISGKVLSTGQYDLVRGENTVTLNTATLLPGYYALIITDGHASQAYKFIK